MSIIIYHNESFVDKTKAIVTVIAGGREDDRACINEEIYDNCHRYIFSHEETVLPAIVHHIIYQYQLECLYCKGNYCGQHTLQ